MKTIKLDNWPFIWPLGKAKPGWSTDMTNPIKTDWLTFVEFLLVVGAADKDCFDLKFFLRRRHEHAVVTALLLLNC